MVLLMRRLARAQNHIRRLTGVLLGLLVVLLASPMAMAQQHIPAGQPIPENIRVVGTNAQGVDTRMTVRYLEATGNTTRNNVPVRVAASTVGRLGGALLRRVGPAAAIYQTLKGIVEGVGWAIDELQQQVVTPGVPREPLASSVWCINFTAGLMCANQPGQLSGAVETYFPQQSTAYRAPCSVGTVLSTHATYRCTRISDGALLVVTNDSRHDRPITGWPANYQNANPGSDPAPISDTDLGNLLKQYPHVVNAVLIDPDTGAVIRTQEVTDALNDLRRALEAAGRGGSTPQPDLQPDTGWEQGEETPLDAEWPGFCDWATTVCDAIEWFRSPDDEYEKPEVPWEELPVEQQDWSSGIGGGSCPQPVTFTVTIAGQTASPRFELQPVCDFATLIRPLVIAIAGIVAVYIVAGLRQSKDA